MTSAPHKPSFWQRIFSADNIFSAIDRGSVDQCREFLRTDPDALTRTDDLGRTPLHVSAYKARNEILSLLLSAGADPHARDRNDATPLHWAAIGGDAQVIGKLIAVGADIHAVDKNSLTPNQLAELRGHGEIALLR